MTETTIETIRKTLADLQCHSHTSFKLQDDLLSFVEQHASGGNALVEVGCYNGGMSAQLAYMAKHYEKLLHIIDVDSHFLNVTKSSIDLTVGSDRVRYHLMDFPTFVATLGDDVRAVLVFLDGDHRYDAVVTDIRALYALDPLPVGAAFHDFSLRYASPGDANVRVDLAIKDVLGDDFPHTRIGEVAGEGKTLRVVPDASSCFHFHERGFSEGVLIEPARVPLKVKPGRPPRVF